MAITTEVFTANGSQKEFQVASKILSENHIRVDIDSVHITSSNYDVVGSVVLLNEAPESGSVVKVTVSTDGEGLSTAPDELTSIAENIETLKELHSKLSNYTNAEFIVDGLPSSASVGDLSINVADGLIYRYNGSAWEVTAYTDNGTQSYPSMLESVDELAIEGNWEGRTVVLSTDSKIYTYTNGEWVSVVRDGVDGVDGADGNSLNFLGSMSTEPSNPNEFDTYYNTIDKTTYVYSGGLWLVVAESGEDGYTPIKGIDYFDGASGSEYYKSTIFKTVPIGTSLNEIDLPSEQTFNGSTTICNNGWTDNPVLGNVRTDFLVISTGTFKRNVDEDGVPLNSWSFTSWSEPAKYSLEFGVDFIDGQNGSYTSFIYKVSNSGVPATPTDGSFELIDGVPNEDIPTGWTDNPTHGSYDIEYMSKATYTYNGTDWVNHAGWSTPVISYLRGNDGSSGSDGTDGTSIISGNQTSSAGMVSEYQSKLGRNPVTGDQYFSTNSSVGSYIYSFNGSTFVQTTATYMNGNYIVNGTIGTTALSADAIYGKRISGSTALVRGLNNEYSSHGDISAYAIDCLFVDTYATGRTYIGAVGGGISGVDSGYIGIGVGAGQLGYANGTGYSLYAECNTSNGAGGNAVSALIWSNVSGKEACRISHSTGGTALNISSGTLVVNGSTVPFTGAHIDFINENEINQIVEGDIIVDVDDNIYSYDINNVRKEVSVSTASMQKSVVGVFVKETTYEEYRSDIQIDQGGGSVPVNINGYKFIQYNAVGEGMVNVCSQNGDISTGDYICTSDIKGKGMRQNDDLLHNYTVSKARECIIWENEVIGENGCFEQDGYKCKMIACTYHCG